MPRLLLLSAAFFLVAQLCFTAPNCASISAQQHEQLEQQQPLAPIQLSNRQQPQQQQSPSSSYDSLLSDPSDSESQSWESVLHQQFTQHPVTQLLPLSSSQQRGDTSSSLNSQQQPQAELPIWARSQAQPSVQSQQYNPYALPPSDAASPQLQQKSAQQSTGSADSVSSDELWHYEQAQLHTRYAPVPGASNATLFVVFGLIALVALTVLVCLAVYNRREYKEGLLLYSALEQQHSQQQLQHQQQEDVDQQPLQQQQESRRDSQV